MNRLQSLEHMNDISESIDCLSRQIYKILQEAHGEIPDDGTLDNFEDAMGQVLAIQLLAEDLDSTISDQLMRFN